MPYYHWSKDRNVKDVFLDGQLCDSVIECDTDEGWLIRHRKNDAGLFFFDPSTGEAAKERVSGEVSVSFNEE
jgi:hypothetical protein